ncbi:hypothetical protein GYMLUDRAFT_74071 [Collybiopsis luxurians FD-317 M1]|uniref:HD domain-containing protein n=1 Tax=Collybiopsis luxurians FD-317 M1 TaxID=944289 RepID=A0A0D0CN18_9AGAR|nr:hypothetical protein GYMLUDRAFT_74071 [Collybiopsis luxurians FD-317 M1]
MCPTFTLDNASNANTSDIPQCVPSDPISRSAYAVAASHLPPAILNHSLRVWIYARTLFTSQSQSQSETIEPPHRLALLFTACIMHDIGATPAFAHIESVDELQRFEIEGADAAVAQLKSSGDPSISPVDIDEVWRAIALHTTPQIAERMGGMVRIVRLAVLTDFGRGDVEESVKKEVESQFGRLEIEKVLGEAIVKQALDSPMPEKKAPAASWPNSLLEAHRAHSERDGVNKRF